MDDLASLLFVFLGCFAFGLLWRIERKLSEAIDLLRFIAKEMANK